MRVLKAPEVVEPVAAISLLALQVALNYPSLDRSNSDVISTFARDVLTPLPKDSLLLVLGEENLYPLVYMQVRGIAETLPSYIWTDEHVNRLYRYAFRLEVSCCIVTELRSQQSWHGFLPIG